jgi:virginiamycin B lyase
VKIKVNISTTRVYCLPSPSNVNIEMVTSETFTPTGDLGNSTASFSEQSFSLESIHTKQVSFIFTPAIDLGSGGYTLMLGTQNDAITVMEAVRVDVLA